MMTLSYALVAALMINLASCSYKSDDADQIAAMKFFDDSGNDYVNMVVEFYDSEEVKVVRHNKSTNSDESIIIHDFRRGVMVSLDITKNKCFIFSFDNIDDDGSRYWKEKQQLKTSNGDLVYLIPRPPNVYYDLGEQLDQCQVGTFGQQVAEMCEDVATYWIYRTSKQNQQLGNRVKRRAHAACFGCSCEVITVMA